MDFVANIMWILAINPRLANAGFWFGPDSEKPEVPMTMRPVTLDAAIERSEGPFEEMKINSTTFRCLDDSGLYSNGEKCDVSAECADESDEYDCEKNYAACGISPLLNSGGVNNRVYYGKDAGANNYPWIVKINQLNGTTGNVYTCGAGIYNNWWVITAAHCVKGFSLEQIKLTFGDHLSTKKDPGEVVKTIKKIIIHKDYFKKDGERTLNDIALVELTKPIEYTAEIRPPCFPNRDVENRDKIVLSGFGKSHHNSDLPNVLQYVDMKVKLSSGHELVCCVAYNQFSF